MRRQSILSLFSCFILGIFLLTTSFNYSAKKNFDEDVTIKVLQAGPVSSAPPADAFYTLYMTVKGFDSLKGRHVLKFVFAASDVLTLQGWKARGLSGRSFDGQGAPFTLQISITKSLDYKKDLAFGDVVLRGSAIKKIKKLIKKNKTYNYVLFVPVADTINGKRHVRYMITLAADPNTPPIAPKLFAGDDTGEGANPSPPKGFNGRGD